jgi:hypothetical protein
MSKLKQPLRLWHGNNVGLEGGEGIEVSAVCLKKR